MIDYAFKIIDYMFNLINITNSMYTGYPKFKRQNFGIV